MISEIQGNIMRSTGIEDQSPELLPVIANYLPPSDVLNFNIASENAAFLHPDIDKVKQHGKSTELQNHPP